MCFMKSSGHLNVTYSTLELYNMNEKTIQVSYRNACNTDSTRVWDHTHVDNITTVCKTILSMHAHYNMNNFL